MLREIVRWNGRRKRAITRSRAQARARPAFRQNATIRWPGKGLRPLNRPSNFDLLAEAAAAGLNADLSALESARAAIRGDEARVTEAKLSLGYTKINAPISGHVGAVMIKAGNLVQGE